VFRNGGWRYFLIPRTGLLAKVTAEEPVADGVPEILRNEATELNGEIT